MNAPYAKGPATPTTATGRPRALRLVTDAPVAPAAARADSGPSALDLLATQLRRTPEIYPYLLMGAAGHFPEF